MLKNGNINMLEEKQLNIQKKKKVGPHWHKA